eukprot:scaffold288028_cov30-Tisochrysis_lutea.AAC.1
MPRWLSTGSYTRQVQASTSIRAMLVHPSFSRPSPSTYSCRGRRRPGERLLCGQASPLVPARLVRAAFYHMSYDVVMA